MIDIRDMAVALSDAAQVRAGIANKIDDTVAATIGIIVTPPGQEPTTRGDLSPRAIGIIRAEILTDLRAQLAASTAACLAAANEIVVALADP